MVHLLASDPLGTVYVVVPLRTFFPTITGRAIAIKFDIYTIGVVVLPASGTPRLAFQPDRRLDEASCKKRADGYRERSHFIAVNLWLE